MKKIQSDICIIGGGISAALLSQKLSELRPGMPATVDGHLPERYAVGDFTPPPPPDTRKRPLPARGLLAPRVLRPPVAVDVIMRDDRIAALAGDIAGDVRLASGPWEIESGWWSESPHARRYWDVELEKGGVYRVYQSSVSNDWFVDARYDW